MGFRSPLSGRQGNRVHGPGPRHSTSCRFPTLFTRTTCHDPAILSTFGQLCLNPCSPILSANLVPRSFFTLLHRNFQRRHPFYRLSSFCFSCPRSYHQPALCITDNEANFSNFKVREIGSRRRLTLERRQPARVKRETSSKSFEDTRQRDNFRDLRDLSILRDPSRLSNSFPGTVSRSLIRPVASSN